MEKEYRAMVTALVKSPHTIQKQLTAQDCHLLHLVVGISTEAGELLSQVKKETIYRTEIDVDNLIEELGDLEFYMSALRDLIGVTRNEVLRANMDKLSKRYPGFTYSDEKAKKRNDKL